MKLMALIGVIACIPAIGRAAETRWSAHPVWHTLHLEGDKTETVADTLIVERDGQVFKTIKNVGFIREWHFWQLGRQLAIYSGPRHFGATHQLLDIRDGHVVENYPDPMDYKTAPTWALPYPNGKTVAPEISAFVDRVTQCLHFAGEEGYSDARKQQIQTSMKNLRCDQLQNDIATLREKEARNAAAQHELDGATREWFAGMEENLENP